MLTDVLEVYGTSPSPEYYKNIGKETALLFYLKVTFRGKDNFKVQIGGQEQEIAQISLVSALTDGIESGQIKLVYTSHKDTAPKVELDKNRSTVLMVVPLRFYKEVENDLSKQIPIADFERIECPNKHLLRSMQDLQTGKIKLRVDPKHLGTTKELSKILSDAYEMWQTLP